VHCVLQCMPRPKTTLALKKRLTEAGSKQQAWASSKHASACLLPEWVALSRTVSQALPVCANQPTISVRARSRSQSQWGWALSKSSDGRQEREGRSENKPQPAPAPAAPVLRGVYKHSDKHAPGKIPRAQCAFKILMIHEVLQFALRIAFRCVLHRCGNLDIHR
jgi:hypothetical protein